MPAGKSFLLLFFKKEDLLSGLKLRLSLCNRIIIPSATRFAVAAAARRDV